VVSVFVVAFPAAPARRVQAPRWSRPARQSGTRGGSSWAASVSADGNALVAAMVGRGPEVCQVRGILCSISLPTVGRIPTFNEEGQ